jgi:hypothetical protein
MRLFEALVCIPLVTSYISDVRTRLLTAAARPRSRPRASRQERFVRSFSPARAPARQERARAERPLAPALPPLALARALLAAESWDVHRGHPASSPQCILPSLVDFV